MLTWQQWLNKAQVSITAGQHSLEAGDLAPAVSRAYFAAFQAGTGALVKRGYQPNSETGNWGHKVTQNQFTILIQQVGSKRRRLRREREHFKALYFYRAFADYGDDSIITTRLARQLVREAGQVVTLIQRLIEEGDI